MANTSSAVVLIGSLLLGQPDQKFLHQAPPIVVKNSRDYRTGAVVFRPMLSHLDGLDRLIVGWLNQEPTPKTTPPR